MDKETECSDVCDAVVYPLKDLGFDVFKDGSDWDLDHNKVVNILNDEVVLKRKKVTLDRVGLFESTKQDAYSGGRLVQSCGK